MDKNAPLAFLAKLQDEAAKTNGFHKELRMWVDDDSSAARALRALAENVS